MFKLPVSILLVGASMSGKSSFIVSFIQQRQYLVDGHINKIYYCCPNKNYVSKEILKLKEVQINEGLPDINDVEMNSLLILDDFLLNLDKNVAEIFTVSCHHKNISVILAIQNLYHRSCPWLRDISLNSQHIVLFRTLRDLQQLEIFFRQTCPHNYKNLLNLYKEVTKQPYTYLIFDFSQKCTDLLRLRTNIFNYGEYFECFGSEKQIEKGTRKENSEDSEELLLSCSFESSNR